MTELYKTIYHGSFTAYKQQRIVQVESQYNSSSSDQGFSKLVKIIIRVAYKNIKYILFRLFCLYSIQLRSFASNIDIVL